MDVRRGGEAEAVLDAEDERRGWGRAKERGGVEQRAVVEERGGVGELRFVAVGFLPSFVGADAGRVEEGGVVEEGLVVLELVAVEFVGDMLFGHEGVEVLICHAAWRFWFGLGFPGRSGGG